MICGLNIRRLTARERAERDEALGMLFDALISAIEAEERAEYEAEFGPVYRAAHPFEFDAVRATNKIAKRMREEESQD